jgi:hypothetical protein
MATEALMVAREIEEAFIHANAFIAVADSWLEKGQIGEARNLVNAARLCAQGHDAQAIRHGGLEE